MIKTTKHDYLMSLREYFIARLSCWIVKIINLSSVCDCSSSFVFLVDEQSLYRHPEESWAAALSLEIRLFIFLN